MIPLLRLTICCRLPIKPFVTLVGPRVSGRRGKGVKLPCCPATVRGDESRIRHWLHWEGAASRMILKPGDLPCRLEKAAFRGGGPSATLRFFGFSCRA